MVFKEIILWLLPLITLLTQMGIVLFFAHVLFFRKGFLYAAYKENKDKLLWMAFVVALLSTFGSLLFSELFQFDPCRLCWLERFLMYPIVLILGIAAVKNDKRIGKYVVPITVVGVLVTGYHYALQILSRKFSVEISCGVQGPACASIFTFDYGYITITLMALTGFVVIGILTYLYRKS